MTGITPPHRFEGEESWLTWYPWGLGAFILSVMGWCVKWVKGITRVGGALTVVLFSSKLEFPDAPCQPHED